MNYFYLTIQSGSLVVEMDEVRRQIVDLDDFWHFFRQKAEELDIPLKDLEIYCSSSIDYPEESTTDPVVIDICRQLRN